MSLEIKEIRLKTGKTQREFAALFGIPLSTLRKWEQGEASPPSYVVNLISRSVPVTDTSLRVIKGADGGRYYYNDLQKQVMDSVGNRITVREGLSGVHEHNLGIYLTDLFAAFYEIQSKFDRDCYYDKKDGIIWV